MPTRYDKLLEIVERHGLEMSFLTRNFEAEQVAAYRQAAEEVNDRIRALRSQIAELSRAGRSSGRERWRLVRETGLLQDIEGRISELGGRSRDIVVQGWNDSQVLARSHLALEVEPVLEAGAAASTAGFDLGEAVDFTKLDTAAIELGMGTALADTVSLTSEMQVALRREVQAGIAAGQNIRTVAGRVDDILEGGASRAEMITRWSVVKGYNLSRQAALEVAETQVVGIRKQWLAQVDERTCPHCLAQHGTVVEVTEEFDPENSYASQPPEPYSGFLLVPPLHPRCRCLILAWHENFRSYTDITPEVQHEEAREWAIREGHWRALQVGIPRGSPNFDLGARLDETFALALSGSSATAVISPFSVTGRRAWLGISRPSAGTRGGIINFVVQSGQAMRLAQFDLSDWGTARREVYQMISDMRAGRTVEGLVQIDAADMGGFVELVDDWQRVDDIADYRGPPRHLVLSREETDIINSLDEFIDYVDEELPDCAVFLKT